MVILYGISYTATGATAGVGMMLCRWVFGIFPRDYHNLQTLTKNSLVDNNHNIII